MPEGVSRRLDDVEPEHAVAVADGYEFARGADRRDVGGAGVGRGLGRCLHDRREAALVVAVGVGQDHVADRVPPEADRLERRLDHAFAAGGAGVDRHRLAATHEEVGGDEAEVDALPVHGAGRATAVSAAACARGVRRRRRRWIGRRGRLGSRRSSGGRRTGDGWSPAAPGAVVVVIAAAGREQAEPRHEHRAASEVGQEDPTAHRAGGAQQASVMVVSHRASSLSVRLSEGSAGSPGSAAMVVQRSHADCDRCTRGRPRLHPLTGAYGRRASPRVQPRRTASGCVCGGLRSALKPWWCGARSA